MPHTGGHSMSEIIDIWARLNLFAAFTIAVLALFFLVMIVVVEGSHYND